MIGFELASNPLWVVIILVNSVDKSTLEDSSEPDVILSPIAITSLPTPSKSPELTVVWNKLLPTASSPVGLANVVTAICPRTFWTPLSYLPYILPSLDTLTPVNVPDAKPAPVPPVPISP